MSKVLAFDVETFDAKRLWDMRPEEFVRVSGYTQNGRDVYLTEDLEELRTVIREADLVIGHNIHAFDLIAVFGKDSIEPLEMARAGRILDTWTHATLANPAPTLYTDRRGRKRLAAKPEQAKTWFTLDQQAYSLGLEGKSMDLKELAKEYGGYHLIPTSDSRFREYLETDVRVAWDVAVALLDRLPFTGYAVREQLSAAIDAQNSRNGWRIDVGKAKDRVAEIEAKNAALLEELSTKYGLPTEGKAPLRTIEGKAAVLAALKSVGITEKHLNKTPKGVPSFGKLTEVVEGMSGDAVELATTLATIGGMRPLAQSALDNVHADGKVHPSITTLQRSGRKSTTEPGLTVWTNRGAGAVEKSYFIPNSDDAVLVEFDYSQADARIVAAYSGDTAFAERFEPGADAHMMTAYAVWGKAEVDSDPVKYRDIAKKLGHAYAHRAGAKKLSATAKQPLSVATKFVEAMKKAYPDVSRWQDRVTAEAKARGYVTNAWGRKMPVEEGREWTQAPALYGQSGTREIVVDALIKMPNEILTMLVAQVHDALVFSLPKERAEELATIIKECMETSWQPPRRGQRVHFPVGQGPYAMNWQEASHN
jgi:DNA polymerase-1